MRRTKAPEPLPRELRMLIAAIVETAQRLIEAGGESTSTDEASPEEGTES
jgi:hypothetical protein